MARPGHYGGGEVRAFDVRVVGEDVAGELGVFVGGEAIVDCGGGVVDRGDGDRHRGGWAGGRAVRCGVGEGVCAVVVGGWGVGERAVGVENQCTMTRSGHHGGGEVRAFDVRVVGEDVAGEDGVFVGGEGVVDGDGCVVDRGDGDRDSRRIAGEAAVGGGVGEGV